jgi:CubicO group peptidase (beta-lactamase class C family)
MTLSDNACAELDTFLRMAVKQQNIPGAVAVVTHLGQIIYRGAFGTHDAHGLVVMPIDALFDIASMTKPVTSVAIMMLKEQGLLDLDQLVGHYLPDLLHSEVLLTVDETDGFFTTRPAARAITIRDLLSHTSGFGYAFSNDTLCLLCKEGRSPRTLPLLHDPGSQWTYGASTAILGEVIERITGESLGQYFQSRIFHPLGMHDTGFELLPEKRNRLVALFRRVDGSLIGESRQESFEPYLAGDGGLLSTADDYIRFLQMFLNMGQFGGTRLLTEQSVHELTRNQIGNLRVQKQPGAIPAVSNPFPIGAGEDTFSLAFQLKTHKSGTMRSPGSYSWAGLFNTHFWVDPYQGIAAVLLMQVLPFYDDQCIRLLTGFERQIYKHWD